MNFDVNIVLKTLYLFCIILTFLQGCMPNNEESRQQILKKPDLDKAATYNVQLGLSYLNQGDRPRAKKKLLTALKQSPKLPEAHSAIAYYFEQTSDVSQAEKYYLSALALSRNGGAQYNNYGAFLCRQGDYNKAEYYFLKAAADLQYVHTAAVYENIGLCALSASQIKKATYYFAKALANDPSRKVSLYELVKIKIKKGYNKEAFLLIQKYTDLVLSDKVLLSLAKDVAKKVGQYDMAITYEKIISQMDPNLDISGANNEYSNYA